MKLRLILSYFLFTSATIAFSQKSALDHNVYDEWQSIGARHISANGNWIGYNINPQEGDRELHLYSVKEGTQLTFPRGKKLIFTPDSRFAIFIISPFYKDKKAVRDKKLKKEKLPKDSLAIVDLLSGNITKIPDIKSFKVAEKEMSLITYHLTPPEKSKEENRDANKKDKDSPSPLVMTDLISGKNTTFDNVVDYALSENGESLAIIIQDQEESAEDAKEESGEDPDDQKHNVQPEKYPLKSIKWIGTVSGDSRQLLAEEGDFTRLNFDKSGERLSFIGTTSLKSDLVKNYRLYYFDTEKSSILDSDHQKLPEGWLISQHRNPQFSEDGEQLYFGIAPAPVPKDTSLNTNDHAIVDIWSYKDDYLQSIQLNRVKRELEKSYLAVLLTHHPETFQPLADEEIENITLINEGNANFVLGYSNKDSRIATQWTGSDRRSYYLIDNLTGKKTQITNRLSGFVSASPSGKYVIYFDRENGHWYSYDTESDSKVKLDEGIDVVLTDELWDMPDAPRPYGIAGWTDHDESVIIKDRYDLWEFFPDGKKPPRNITRGYGRKNQITFETYHFDKDKKTMDRNSSMYLSAFDHHTKQQGIFRTIIHQDQDPEKIFMDDIWGMRNLQKAKNAETYIYTKENYTHSPDLYISGNFTEEIRVTKTNPQQKNYNWGTAELFRWITDTGKESAGILYKPEDFDPDHKYPMIVYFYERLSDGLNRYIPPTPTPSRLNISFFVSNGYLVFTPDIAYTDGYPGRSAEEYVNSGVEHLKKNPWVDEQRIGIQGQSWGGYQVAHLITRTDMYAAAWSGAPVVNMTSAYGGIRWGTGMNRQFQYEKTQSRIGKTLWEDLDLYIENSPLFHLDQVNTPVVIMANDKDGAVPWWQGIEMFTALRRLGKPSWMLNYNDDEHNLMKRQNRKDIQIRQKQFFDYYLKNAKAPVWMTRGIPATMKGKTWGFELTEEEP